MELQPFAQVAVVARAQAGSQAGSQAARVLPSEVQPLRLEGGAAPPSPAAPAPTTVLAPHPDCVSAGLPAPLTAPKVLLR